MFDLYVRQHYASGECMHLNVLGQSIIVLNNGKTASDLLDKRSAIYSSRPRLVSDYVLGLNIRLKAPSCRPWQEICRYLCSHP